MKNIWKKWENLVERHNEDITYVNYEDCYSPSDIVLPLLFSFIWAVIFGLYALSFKVFFGTLLGMGSLTYLGFFISFLASFPRKKRA